MKSKYDRRRAIECKLERKSNSNPGYFKYRVTIREKDGTKHTEPCYGKDMQDALSRLINTERTVKVEKKIENNVLWILLIWAAIMGWPTLITDGGSPMYILYMFISVITMFGLAALWYNYINKK